MSVSVHPRFRFPPGRGAWWPGNTSWAIALTFQLGLLESALVRGLDYALSDGPNPSSLNLVERALPLQVWGALFLAGWALCISGMLSRTFTLQMVGHALVGSLYAGIGYGVYLSDGEPRTFNGLIVAGLVLHGCYVFDIAGKRKRVQVRRDLAAE